MVKYLILFVVLALIACSGSDEDPSIRETTAARADAELNVGDRIPQATSDQTSASIDLSAYREIGWEELMPPGEEERLAKIYQQQMAMVYSRNIIEGSAADAMVQIGTFNTVAELDEIKVRIPGYTVPFEYGSNAEISEFLLVPYYGACIHAPPPPPNQTIFVTAQQPIRLRDLAQAVWVNGTIYTKTKASALADSAYTIHIDSVEIYEY